METAANDQETKQLLEALGEEAGSLPVVLFPMAPGSWIAFRRRWRRRLDCALAHKPISMTWRFSAAGLPDWRRPSTVRRKACTRSSWSAKHREARPE